MVAGQPTSDSGSEHTRVRVGVTAAAQIPRGRLPSCFATSFKRWNIMFEAPTRCRATGCGERQTGLFGRTPALSLGCRWHCCSLVTMDSPRAVCLVMTNDDLVLQSAPWDAPRPRGARARPR